METTIPQNVSYVLGRSGRNPSSLEINCQLMAKIEFLFALSFPVAGKHIQFRVFGGILGVSVLFWSVF